MSHRLAHKRKLKAKRFGARLVRYALFDPRDGFQSNSRGLGKNRVHVVFVGLGTASGTGKSYLAEYMAAN